MDRNFTAYLQAELRKQMRGITYSVADVAPATYADLVAHGRNMVVWSGASDNTIWGSPESNHMFRAWHDSIHLAYGLDFSKSGELAVAELSRSKLGGVIGNVVYAEVAGQVEYFERFGDFPKDQLNFTLAYMRQGRVTNRM